MATVSSAPGSVEIDFLPAHYREQTAQRRGQAGRMTLACLFALALAATSFYQQRIRHGVEEKIAALAPLYSATEANRTQLKQLTEKLHQYQAQAELITYLCHPWPRSQILTALLPALPESITLSSIHLDDTHSGGSAATVAAARDPHQEAKAEQTKLSAVERDLATLREQRDGGRVVLLISGIAADPAQLHKYLSELSGSSLFIKAELVSMESMPAAGPRSSESAKSARFRVRLVVRPGYGQPNGPQHEADGHRAKLAAEAPQ